MRSPDFQFSSFPEAQHHAEEQNLPASLKESVLSRCVKGDVSEGVSLKSKYPQKCLVESQWEIPGQKCSLSIPSSVPMQGISVVLLQPLSHCPVLSQEPWAGAVCSCALWAQHRYSSSGSSWSKGKLSHCSLIPLCWSSPTPSALMGVTLAPDRQEGKQQCCGPTSWTALSSS